MGRNPGVGYDRTRLWLAPVSWCASRVGAAPPPAVPDPRAPLKSGPVSLDYVGHGVVVASPEGQPAYTPPSDWCRSTA